MATDEQVESYLLYCAGLTRVSETQVLNLELGPAGRPAHLRDKRVLLWIRHDSLGRVLDHGVVVNLDRTLVERDRLLRASDGMQDLIVLSTRSEVRPGMSIDELMTAALAEVGHPTDRRTG